MTIILIILYFISLLIVYAYGVKVGRHQILKGLCDLQGAVRELRKACEEAEQKAKNDK